MSKLSEAVEKQDTSQFVIARYRRLSKRWRVITLVSPAMALILGIVYIFHIIVFGKIFIEIGYLYLLMALFVPLIFIWLPAGKGAPRDRVPWYDVILVLVSFAVLFFLFSEAESANVGWGVEAPVYATVAAAIIWAVLVEAARRTINLLFAVVVLVFSTYPLYAFIMPALLQTKRFSLSRTINYHAFSDVSIVGIPMGVFGGLLFGFMVFALAIQTAGAGKFFNDISLALLRQTRGGAAKVSVVASGLFGTISGSPVANVLVDGGITIPAMKRAGFPGYFAGAVEAVASTGGALMPPVMGTAAFIMAEFLGVSYARVATAAVLPSLLYYVTLFLQIDAYSARHGVKPEPIDIIVPKIRWILLDNLHILLGFFILVYLLFAMDLINWSPWISTGIVFALAMVRKKTRLYLRDYLSFIENLGRTLGELVGILSSVGLIVGAFILTGMAHALPYSIITASHGNIYIMLVLGALAAFILGMGVPIVACYIFLAISLAPGLVLAGVNPMAAHLFVMYCAMLSFITPPVALAAFTAAVLAGADPMRTGFQACRLGISTFILPFFFVLSPALILQGPLLDSLWVFSTAVLGLALISAGFEGYLWWVGPIGMPVRVLFFGTGLVVAYPGLYSDFVGLGIAAAIIIILFIQKAAKRKSTQVPQGT